MSTCDCSPSEQGSVGQVCRGVVTSLNMTLLYANTGQFDSPSAIITGAMLSYGTEDITAVVGKQYPCGPIELHYYAYIAYN